MVDIELVIKVTFQGPGLSRLSLGNMRGSTFAGFTGFGKCCTFIGSGNCISNT
jgi:hypothetical protein